VFTTSIHANRFSSWDTRLGKEIRKLEECPPMVLDVKMSRNGNVMVIRSHNDDMSILSELFYRTDTCKQFALWPNHMKREKPGDQWTWSDARTTLSPDGSKFAFPIWNESIEVRDVRTRTKAFTLQEPDGSIKQVAYSPDGRWLLTAAVGRGGYVMRLWDAQSGKPLPPLGRFEDGIEHLVFTADSRLIAAIELRAPYGDLTVWETTSGQELVRLTEECNPAEHADFSPDGKTLVSTMRDGTGLVWSLAPQAQAGLGQDKSKPLDLKALWNDLADGNAKLAYAAVWALGAVPEKYIPFLRKNLPRLSTQERDRIRALIAMLDDGRFSAREDAQKTLRELGWMAVLALRKAYAGNPSQESRRRMEILLEPFPIRPVRDPGMLRGLRAIWVLERIGTPEALALLREFAESDPDDPLKEESQLALQRLADIGAAKRE